jgi:hypothetical protein
MHDQISHTYDVRNRIDMAYRFISSVLFFQLLDHQFSFDCTRSSTTFPALVASGPRMTDGTFKPISMSEVVGALR